MCSTNLNWGNKDNSTSTQTQSIVPSAFVNMILNEQLKTKNPQICSPHDEHINVTVVKKRVRQPISSLNKYYSIDLVELGIDEVGRGPLFGRVYAGAVVLPKDDSFEHTLMKDSKRFHSKKKIEDAAEYIKQRAIAWAVEYEDEQLIDEINILQATQSAMHKAIKSVINALSIQHNQVKQSSIDINNVLLLVDGNYFKQYNYLNSITNKIDQIKYVTIEGGDNKYTSIAAASILAKVERDKYIENLCIENPELIERYNIDSNKGYGAKKHMNGIEQYGITKWHRKSFGICKKFA